MSKKKNNQSRTWLRVVAIIFGLGFAASSAAIGLSGFLGQNNSNSNVSESNNTANAPDAKALQMQISGYEKVLEREPKNPTALQGLAQIYLQTGKIEKAVPVIEKLAAYYPEQPEYAQVLQVIKQQQAQQGNKK
jgi:predicted Zn-dependent protease